MDGTVAEIRVRGIVHSSFPASGFSHKNQKIADSTYNRFCPSPPAAGKEERFSRYSASTGES
jgi:hypothetical protein